jgi:hypothetical protein
VIGIFRGNADGTAWEPVALQGAGVPGQEGTTFSSFEQPVLSPRVAGGLSKVAFVARLSRPDSRVTPASLWVIPENGILTLVAQEGMPAAECPGAVWSKFKSIALPGGETGPLFVATLQVGDKQQSKSTQSGVWVLDSTGNVRLLFREGTSIGNTTLRSFTALQTVRGSPGVTRAFNNFAEFIWLGRFDGGAAAIVQTTLP